MKIGKGNGRPPRRNGARTPQPQSWAMTAPRPVPRRSPAGARAPMMQPPQTIPPPGDDDGVDGMPLDMMGPDETGRVAEFLTDCYSVGPVAELALHQVAGGTHTMIRDWSGPELAEATDAQGLAGEIVSVAQEDCEHAGLPVGRYVVSAMRQSGGPAIRRCFFTVKGPAFNGATFADEYGGEAIAAQQMRHNEAILRLALGGQSAVARTLMLMNHELMADARDAKRAQLQAVELREQMLDRQAERGLALRREQLSVDRRERMYRIVESYVPHVAHRLGLPTSPAMQQLTAVAGNGTASNGARPAGAVDLDAEQIARLHRVTAHVLGWVAGLTDDALALALARIPAEARDDVRAARDYVRTRAEQTRDGGEPPPADDEGKRRILALRGHVVQMLAAMSDGEMDVVLAQLDERVRADVAQMRVTIRAKLAQPGAPAVSGAVSTPTGSTAPNGAAT